ncbi:uncharacterized protein [Littorina saxatilis]|uniref:uncharacterized protein n=1 Tax=Littorina saxatilis TaxID=31220 RepID=UPI0038B43EA1
MLSGVCRQLLFLLPQVAKRVAAREHALKSYPVQVEVCSSPPTLRAEAALTPEGRPSRTQARVKITPLPSQPGRRSATSTNAASEYRVKVSGVPSGTSADCLQNYLECVLGISVTSIALSKGRNSAVVIMSNSSGDELDLPSINSACVESPLEEGSLVSFVKVSSSPSSVIRVTGLKPKTADEAVQFFFSNKRRNQGGPAKRVERSQDKASALVHFIKHEDAEAVVKKGDHTLDGNPLHVTLHDEADSENESDESERRRSVSSMDGESFRRDEPSSDDEYAADQEGKAAQSSKGGLASREGEYARGNTDFMSNRQHESAVSSSSFSSDNDRDKNKGQYSSSALAQMKPREDYDEGMGDPRRLTDEYPQQGGSRYQEDPSKALKRQTDGYRGQADSGLIDSFRSPKKDKNEFKVKERMERAPSNQYSGGSNSPMLDCRNLRPTAASSTKKVTRNQCHP